MNNEYVSSPGFMSKYSVVQKNNKKVNINTVQKKGVLSKVL